MALREAGGPRSKSMQRPADIAGELAALTGLQCASAPARTVGGGSIHECYQWPYEGGQLFVKVGPTAALAAFEAEAAGLAELARAGALRVPRVYASGRTSQDAFLALEWIERGHADAACESRLGAGLAALHAVTAPRFGLAHDNLIGRTPQENTWGSDWAEFFRDRRLLPQLARAAKQRLGRGLTVSGERLLQAVPGLLAGHAPAASLLHGDLWGGNWLCAAGGEPVVFDPSVYYGDRETDLAMTRLFGGFGAAFYQAYESVYPPAPGWRTRADLYNLYHLLNHANLFGGGYVQQAQALMERLLAHGGH